MYIKKFFSKDNFRKLLDDSMEGYGNFYFDLLLIFLVLFSSLLFVFKTYNLNPSVEFLIDVFDYLIMIIFTFELFFRNYFAKEKKKYFFSLGNIFDLLAIIPFWFVPGVSLQFLRVFRVLKLFRFFGKYLNQQYVKKRTLNQILIAKMVSVLFVLLYVSSSLIFVFESPKNENISTFADAFYLSLVTVTTVGFGDIVPVSQEGRTVIMFVILFGIFLIPVYIGTLLRSYIKNSTKKDFACGICGHRFHDDNAVHCKMCGDILFDRQHGE